MAQWSTGHGKGAGLLACEACIARIGFRSVAYGVGSGMSETVIGDLPVDSDSQARAYKDFSGSSLKILLNDRVQA